MPERRIRTTDIPFGKPPGSDGVDGAAQASGNFSIREFPKQGIILYAHFRRAHLSNAELPPFSAEGFRIAPQLFAKMGSGSVPKQGNFHFSQGLTRSRTFLCAAGPELPAA